jgi:Domain of unknown function (DUF3560)
MNTDPTPEPTSPADSGTRPETAPLHLLIDGDDVVLTGTIKGNDDHRRLVPAPWKWSRFWTGYVLPRNLLPLTRRRHIDWLLTAASKTGTRVDVEDTGRTLTEADRRQARTHRLADRADRHENVAQRATREAAAAETARRAISDHIPPGQPVLVGHHSEGRHRRALERLDTLDRKGLEAERVAHRRAALAAGIRRTLERGDSPVTIRLRIERTETEIRRLQRYLDRHTAYLAEHPDAGPGRTGELQDELDRLQESADIDRATIAELEATGQVVTYGPHNVKVGEMVRCNGSWYPVLRVNKKSVTVPSIVGGPWTDTLPYTKITDCRLPEPAHTSSTTSTTANEAAGGAGTDDTTAGGATS